MLGVYLTAAELTTRGFIVSPTSRSAVGADLLVTDPRCRTAWSVQVKTQAASANYWLAGKNAQKLNSPSHVYVFVNLRGMERPEYLVVPSSVVAAHTYDDKGFYCFDRAEGKSFIGTQGWHDQAEEGWEVFGDPKSDLDPLPSYRDLKAVLNFLPTIERLSGREVTSWDGGEKHPDGTLTFPYAVYPELVDILVQTLYALGFIINFDWMGWWRDAETYIQNGELLRNASLEICVKLLTGHVRNDRFFDGHLGQVISSGHILAILRRLESIQAAYHG
ncbi:MAG: hypothetical protein KGK08_12650 [Acidobacteriota bacterium]|nr:hypothetical protein [Acidobacteriota bacterium]